MAQAIEFGEIGLHSFRIGSRTTLRFSFSMPGFRRGSVFGFGHASIIARRDAESNYQSLRERTADGP
jgi:hypothetical protein